MPVGRHRATLADIHERFVEAAPFSAEREVVYRALLLYVEQVWDLFPGARLWVDGGFVTQKDWEPPSDVDVAFIVRASDALSVPDVTLMPLLTHPLPDGTRVQPMGGKVDGFVVYRGDAEEILYWDRKWSNVMNADGDEVPGAVKGYVEVMPDE